MTTVDGALAGTRFFDDVWGAWIDVLRARNRIWAAWKDVWEALERRSRAWNVGEAWNDALGALTKGLEIHVQVHQGFPRPEAPTENFE